MRILWITNIQFPYTCETLHISVPNVGGWMYSSAISLLKSYPDLDLCIATVYSGTELIHLNDNLISYYLLPSNSTIANYNSRLEKYWKRIKENFKPDIIHIHGTEYTHGLAYIRSCGKENVVLSIQGLTSVICNNYYAGMSIYEILRSVTIRDLLRCDTLIQQKIKMKKRGIFEKEYLLSVDHVIGRTLWDKAYTKVINNKLIYHYCNETLREGFYDQQWIYKNCIPHSIFLSQAGYPLKGLHIVLRAVSLLIDKYPDIIINVAGHDITRRSEKLGDFKRCGYGSFILGLMKKYNIENNIRFLGPLSEKEMIDQYLKTNLFICPSIIENSPNSLCEAQILGVPYLTSYVGGIRDLVKNVDNIYPYEDVLILAELIHREFTERNVVNIDEIKTIRKRHCNKTNSRELYKIYKNICLS